MVPYSSYHLIQIQPNVSFLSDFPDPGDRDLYNGIHETNKNNYQKSLGYFEKSARYDNEYDALFVALFHFAGFGMTKRKPSKALELFKVIASVWKNPIAEYLIGVIYCEGDRGVPKDEKTGIKWFILAEKNGWSDVMTSAAIHCFPAASEGGKLKMALAWLENVANDDDTDAELIDNSTLYLFGNKNFELSMAHIELEVQRILHSKEEYNIVSSIKHLQRECDPRIISNYKKLQ